jgi:hypothetical protein
MRAFLFILSTVFVCFLAGCGSPASKPKADTFPVAGGVKYKGAPLADATLEFAPKGDTRGFTGKARTDKEGKYNVSDMHGNKGLVAGEYSVTVSRRVMPGGAVVPADDKTPPIESQASESLPAHLSNPEQTKVTIRVTAEKAEYNLDLK